MRAALSTLFCLALVSTALGAPANEVGQIFAKAKAADGFARLPRQVFFEGESEGDLLMFEFGRSDDSLRVELFEVRLAQRTWKSQRCTLGHDGQLRSLIWVQGAGLPPRPKPGDVAVGKPRAGKLVFETAEGKSLPGRELKLADEVIPMAVALFVLPAYAELLPAELSLTVLTEGKALPMKLRLGKVGKDRREVVLTGPGQLELKVAVSTEPSTLGDVLHLEVGGEEKRPFDKELAKQRIEAAGRASAVGEGEAKPGFHATPRAAVEALIKACRAKDLKAAGACFSPDAPKEFQSLRDGTCPPKMFAQLCDMFAEATIDGETMGKDGKSCAVAVTLSTRKETLNVVKGPGGWLILDF